MNNMKNHRLPIRSWTQKAYACNPIHVGTFPAIRISLKPTSNETDETLSEVNANDARKNQEHQLLCGAALMLEFTLFRRLTFGFTDASEDRQSAGVSSMG
jgi:hypothetical protein